MQVHDPSCDTWTLFDDEKVRHIPGVNSHGTPGGAGGGKKAKGAAAAAGKGGGGGGRGIRTKKQARASSGEDQEAEADSEADAEFLREVSMHAVYACGQAAGAGSWC